MIFNRTYRDLLGSAPLGFSPRSPASLVAVQSRRLHRLFDYCFRYSPFYRDVLADSGFKKTAIGSVRDLECFPVLTKSMVKERISEMVSSQVNPALCNQRHTSGTSGVEFTLPELPLEAFIANMQWSRIYMRSGLRPWQRHTKISALARFGSRKYFVQGMGLFRRDYIDSTDSPALKVEKLKKSKPGALVCWASMLDEITTHLEGTRTFLDIPLVFSTANMLWPGTRKRAEEKLNAKVFDVYGAVETGPVAWECEHHHGYHVQSDQVLVELLDAHGRPAKKGRMVCTVLWRRTVPLIRYAIGDSAEWSDSPCPCGSPYPLLKSLDGRETDLVRLPDGTLINSVTLRHAMIGKPGVEQYQLVQETPIRFRLRIVGNARYSEKVGQSIKDEFRKQFAGSLEIKIVTVAKISMPPAVKFTPMLTLERLSDMKSRGVDTGVMEVDE